MSNNALPSRRLMLTLAVAAVAAAACTTTPPDAAPAPRANEGSIDAQADAALSRLYGAVSGSRELVARARGVLICPSVVGGSFVVGFEHGRCVLREPRRGNSYYTASAGSVGFQAGAQSRALYYVFTTQQAVDQFRASNGWTAGAEANVAVATVGANASIDSTTANQPVISMVLNNAGLEAGVSVQGMKFTPYKP